MEWINPKEKEPLIGKHYLCVVDRKKAEKEREFHIGHYSPNIGWIVGNMFGFDMGEITHYAELPEFPQN